MDIYWPFNAMRIILSHLFSRTVEVQECPFEPVQAFSPPDIVDTFVPALDFPRQLGPGFLIEVVA